MGGRGANGKKMGISCPYNKQQFSVCCRPLCMWEHWNIRPQMWLFQPPGFTLARSAPVRTHRGTRANVFNCMTWLSVASDVNPGLSMHSTLVFRTGALCRCTQSCTAWTSARPWLRPHVERTGLDDKAPHSSMTCTFQWRERQAENGMGANTELRKCKTGVKRAAAMSREANLTGLPFPHQLPPQPWNTGVGNG